MDQKVVFLSGAMNYTGYKAEFFKMERELQSKGYVVLNPAMLPEEIDRNKAIRICYAMIDAADMVYMLHGWTRSEGARLEYQHCTYIGKTVIGESV